MKSTPELDRALTRLETVLEKFNPYHGAGGRFTSGGGGGTMAPDTGGGFGGGGGGSEASVTSSKVSFAERQKEWEKSITDMERAAFSFYTSTMAGCKRVRKCHSGDGPCSEETNRVIDLIKGATERAPKVERKVYRGLHFGSSSARVKFLAQIIKDNGMDVRTYTSTTTDKKVAENFALGRKGGPPKMSQAFKGMEKAVIFSFRSKSGVNISKLNGYKMKEVLQPGKFRLRLVKIEPHRKEQVVHIQMEIDE